MLRALAFAIAALALSTAAAQETDPRCESARSIEPPPADLPDAAAKARLAGCDAATLYYGIAVHTHRFGSYKQLLPLVFFQVALTHGIAVLGILVSAVVGYLTIKYFLRFLAGHRLDVFAYYRLALAAAAFFWFWRV